ncbi:GDSL lipase/esterase [Dillenia turbinata]|uniref:GDSL lipase/esterase n=1 Tax=Dillenia turbinata TaxID=194707 RepID=A0AAN8VDP5_9MAGN
MEKPFLIFSLLLSIFVSAASLDNAQAIFAFGDSIFDPGNNHYNKNCTAQADFPPYGINFFHKPTGRFTNGRLVVDFIAQFMGLELQKPFMEALGEFSNGSIKSYPSNGINFASAGSGVVRDTNADWVVTPIQDQLKQFQELVLKNQIDKTTIPKSLFLFESGSNDIFNYLLALQPPELNPTEFVQAMIAQVGIFVDQIHKLGARRIAIFSLGPVGCIPARMLLPEGRTDRCLGKMNRMIKDYNLGLETLVNDIPKKYPGAFAVYGAVYNIVQNFRAYPDRYAFLDATNACCGDGPLRGLVQCGKEGYKLCSNPDRYLFWDYFHPSEHTYHLISKALWGGGQSQIRPINLKTLLNITSS